MAGRPKEAGKGRAEEPRLLRGLSRDDIVATAIAVADAEGTAAVSMRRIARDLHVGAMSLYWHVESKDELHQLMLEAVHGEIEAAEPSGDWRADLAVYARDYRAALHRHPWAIDFLGVGPPSGPNDARNADRLIGALDGPRPRRDDHDVGAADGRHVRDGRGAAGDTGDPLAPRRRRGHGPG